MKPSADRGRRNQLARQIGEYLAAAELGRRGWIATTFTGSLPGFDILAVNEQGRILEVQVKAIRKASWQLDVKHFLEIELKESEQFVRGPKAISTTGRVCIFIIIGETGKDEFFVFRWKDLQDILLADYKGGRRARNPETTHHALYPKRIEHFRNNWAALQ
jgi:hypothetical protein